MNNNLIYKQLKNWYLSDELPTKLTLTNKFNLIVNEIENINNKIDNIKPVNDIYLNNNLVESLSIQYVSFSEYNNLVDTDKYNNTVYVLSADDLIQLSSNYVALSSNYLTLLDDIQTLNGLITNIHTTDIYLNNNLVDSLSVQHVSFSEYSNLTLDERTDGKVYVISDDILTDLSSEQILLGTVVTDQLSGHTVLADNLSTELLKLHNILIGEGEAKNNSYVQGYNNVSNKYNFILGLNNTAISSAYSEAAYSMLIGENLSATQAGNFLAGWYASDNNYYRTHVINLNRIYDIDGYPMDTRGGKRDNAPLCYFNDLSGEMDIMYKLIAHTYNSPSCINFGNFDLSGYTWEEIALTYNSIESFKSAIYDKCTLDWQWYLARALSSHNTPYASHGICTYNINLANKHTDFYINDSNLQEIIHYEQSTLNNIIQRAIANDQSLYINTNAIVYENAEEAVQGQTFIIDKYFKNDSYYKPVSQYIYDYAYLTDIIFIQSTINKEDKQNNNIEYAENNVDLNHLILSAAIVSFDDNDFELRADGYIHEDNIIAFSLDTISNYSDFRFKRTLLRFNNVKLNTNNKYALVFFDSYDSDNKKYHGHMIKAGKLFNDPVAGNEILKNNYTLQTTAEYLAQTCIAAISVKFPSEPIIEDANGSGDKYVLTINNGQLIPIKINE